MSKVNAHFSNISNYLSSHYITSNIILNLFHNKGVRFCNWHGAIKVLHLRYLVIMDEIYYSILQSQKYVLFWSLLNMIRCTKNLMIFVRRKNCFALKSKCCLNSTIAISQFWSWWWIYFIWSLVSNQNTQPL